MMVLRIEIVLSAICWIFLPFCLGADSELLLVHVVWNHGSSSPRIPIPSDEKNSAETWRLGLGETTQVLYRFLHTPRNFLH